DAASPLARARRRAPFSVGGVLRHHPAAPARAVGARARRLRTMAVAALARRGGGAHGRTRARRAHLPAVRHGPRGAADVTTPRLFPDAEPLVLGPVRAPDRVRHQLVRGTP